MADERNPTSKAGPVSLHKVLVANRGEIACRIMRTAKQLGLATVAVYSDADADALHVARADEAVHIGPAPASESYLRIDKIVAAAKATGADCVHPGYGFLSENANFAEAVRAAGLVFIGPPPDAMRALGDKSAAKALAEKLAIPIVPGSRGDRQDTKALVREAQRIGYPVMIKAVAGGGGRGMRAVESAAEFAAHLESAVREAVSSFGDGRVFIEKLIQRPRHIEVQIFADAHGNAVHLFERDCSLQRRHQKVIEEAPAPGMSEGLRTRLTNAAVRLAKAAKYEGAGTVEFLVEGGTLAPDATFYFIEVNTRLQVEHPVTEEVTGLDLVAWQFRAAAGEPLPKRQNEITLCGHAIEARLCAEDPAQGFAPSVGRLVECSLPQMAGLRVEAAIAKGGEVTPFYDSMIAKIITRGVDRGEALARLDSALTACRVMGPRTNAHFLRALTRHAGVGAGHLDTGLIGRDLAALTQEGANDEAIAFGVRCLLTPAPNAAPARQGPQQRGALSPQRHPAQAGSGQGWAAGGESAAQGHELGQAPPARGDGDRGDCTESAVAMRECWRLHDPWSAGDAFTLGPPRQERREVAIDGVRSSVGVIWSAAGPEISAPHGSGTHNTGNAMFAVCHGGAVYVLADLRQTIVSWALYGGSSTPAGEDGGNALRAPITGRIAKVFVTAGAVVAKGDRLAIVEAMKMEHVLHAPRAGTISRLAVREGQQIARGGLIADIDSDGDRADIGKTS